MAKRTKTAARAGKVKQPAQKPEWKAIETKREIEEDVGSDDGSFMDDDTEDFLPSGWTGTVKGKMESLTAQGPRTHVAVPDPKSPQSQRSLKKDHQHKHQASPNQRRSQKSPSPDWKFQQPFYKSQ
jgi:hypothetical protein